MSPGKPNLAAIAEEILAERANAVTFSDAEIDAEVARLRAGFERIRASAPERRRLAAQIENLPVERRAGWREGVTSAMKVVLGEARRTSHILLDAARDLLPAEPDGWAFTPVAAGTTRGGAEATRVESRQEGTAVSRTVLVDDSGDERRILATIRNIPAGEAPPVLLVAADEEGADLVVEIDPQIDAAERGLRTLRYEAVLPPGAYFVFFGNPRRAGL